MHGVLTNAYVHQKVALPFAIWPECARVCRTFGLTRCRKGTATGSTAQNVCQQGVCVCVCVYALHKCFAN